jgi:hypothetical protein
VHQFTPETIKVIHEFFWKLLLRRVGIGQALSLPMISQQLSG